MKTEVITVTPEDALEILNRSERNFRTASACVVARYATDMKNKMWHLNGVPLIFNGDGSCIDGQHRLLACIEADTPFTTMAVFGVTSAAGVDEGRVRSAAQWLAYQQVASGKDVASITRLAIQCEADEFGKRTPRQISNAQVLDYYRRHAKRLDDCARIVSHQRVIPRAVLGAVLYWGTKKGFSIPSESLTAMAFIEGIKDGVNLDASDPRLALRNRILAVGRHERIDKISLRAITVMAWNKCVNRKPIKQIKWATSGRSAQDFPKILQAIE